jgi:hypothetical protein
MARKRLAFFRVLTLILTFLFHGEGTLAANVKGSPHMNPGVES